MIKIIQIGQIISQGTFFFTFWTFWLWKSWSCWLCWSSNFKLLVWKSSLESMSFTWCLFGCGNLTAMLFTFTTRLWDSIIWRWSFSCWYVKYSKGWKSVQFCTFFSFTSWWYWWWLWQCADIGEFMWNINLGRHFSKTITYWISTTNKF